MKLLFSEAKSDYAHYVFPYAIWAFPEGHETASDCFEGGFLPSSYQLERFYLCRQIRVCLKDYAPSSENRRILRKGAELSVRLVPRADYDFTPERRTFFKQYADIKFGKDVMSLEKLDLLFASRMASHLLVVEDPATGKEIGTAVIYQEPPRTAYYYYAFYDLAYYERNLGMFLMTSAVSLFASQQIHHLYLGTCYSANALYKAQFAGSEFFTGCQWSRSLKELKFIIQRDQGALDHHLLESTDYRNRFEVGGLPALAAKSCFQARPPQIVD